MGTFAGAWGVAMVGFAGFVLHFRPATVGYLFLLIVVSVAMFSGFWEATAVSLLACGTLDYFFYEPIFVFTVSDPQDYVALGAFELSALVVSRLSSKERRTSLEARLHRTAMEQLYELGRSTLLINMYQPAGQQIAQLIQRIFSLEAVAVFDAESATTSSYGRWNEHEENLARDSYITFSDDQDPLTNTWRRILRVGPNAVGALAIRGIISPLTLDALTSMAAITLDRCASFEKETRIEAAHKNERLRAAVLDTLAHAFKTSLTAIQTANSGMSEVGKLNGPQRELSDLISTECTDLISLCTRLLQTAKLEPKQIRPEIEEIRLSDLVSAALKEQSGRMGDHKVEVAIERPELTICGDIGLLSTALAQYLDNAAKYSYAGSKIKIAARESRSEVLFAVHNLGPVIPLHDREKIFERFYRSEGTRNLVEGTGIGLSAVKLAAEIHHGHAWVVSDTNEGTTFYLSISGRNQS